MTKTIQQRIDEARQQEITNAGGLATPLGRLMAQRHKHADWLRGEVMRGTEPAETIALSAELLAYIVADLLFNLEKNDLLKVSVPVYCDQLLAAVEFQALRQLGRREDFSDIAIPVVVRN